MYNEKNVQILCDNGIDKPLELNFRWKLELLKLRKIPWIGCLYP